MNKCFIVSVRDENDELEYISNYKENSLNYVTDRRMAEKFDEKTAMKIVKEFSKNKSKAILNVSYFPRKIGDIDQYFYTIGNYDFFIDTRLKLLEKYGLVSDVKDCILNYHGGDWDWILQSSPVNLYFDVTFNNKK